VEAIITMLLLFSLPTFLLGWPLEYGLCALTEKSRGRTLWRSLPFVAAVVGYFLWQDRFLHAPIDNGPWCPTGSGLTVLLASFILFGALAGMGFGWYRQRKKEKKAGGTAEKAAKTEEEIT